jgi:hypothetical protein
VRPAPIVTPSVSFDDHGQEADDGGEAFDD